MPERDWSDLYFVTKRFIRNKVKIVNCALKMESEKFEKLTSRDVKQ